jgi:hypothetical protein
LRNLLASAGIDWPDAALELRLEDLDLGVRALISEKRH